MATSKQVAGEFIASAADGEADTPPVVRPALRTLLYDQAALFNPEPYDRDIEYGLRGGFPELRNAVEWYQRATVRTFGNLADEWPPEDLILDHTLLGALVENAPIDVEPLPDERARYLRELYEATIVHPACVDAYQELRTSAGEYVGTDGPNVDPYDVRPQDQANVAMRPGYQVLDQQQLRTLTTLWGGFDSRTHLLDWIHSLNAPTAGEIDPELAQDTLVDGVAMDHLLHEPDTESARSYRIGLAVSELLPAFVKGVRSLSAGEAIELKREDTAPTPSI